MSKDSNERIEALLEQQGLLQKPVLNFKEGCIYTGNSESYMYKLTSKRKIPFFKPQGKKIFFKRQELDEWLLRNRIEVQEETEHHVLTAIDKHAADYLIKKGKVKL